MGFTRRKENPVEKPMVIFFTCVMCPCHGLTWALLPTEVDGGFTDSIPVLPTGRTVTVSPFGGRSDISPQDKGQPELYINVANQNLILSVANLVRLNQALFPPSKRKMESLHQCGFDDAIRFLLKENWFE
ncbi:patatin-like phospholipase domain-containing protein 4 [Choloepus didactylus]|uniref:patatin-like phospholipase domain-containing protein 4 n=1 Tax=Choloepus didactylus TaxID=27675 RepID=UPI0018A06E61|nr:patatin-like phospholipase domain-containing protein 4 [Choloepus didactylus]